MILVHGTRVLASRFQTAGVFMLFYIFSLFCCVSSAVASGAMPLKSSYRFMGELRIQNQRNDDAIAPFTLYFDGREIKSDAAGVYSITVSGEDVRAGRLDNFSLMICKELQVELDQGHTLSSIRMKNLNKCLWYKLDREWDAQKKAYYWLIKQQEIGEADCVPASCLVLITSGNNVVEVTDTSHLSATAQGVDGVLPSIVLKTDDTRRSVQSAIASIDVRMHTAPQAYDTLVQNGVECRLYR